MGNFDDWKGSSDFSRGKSSLDEDGRLCFFFLNST